MDLSHETFLVLKLLTYRIISWHFFPSFTLQFPIVGGSNYQWVDYFLKNVNNFTIMSYGHNCVMRKMMMNAER